MKIHKFYNIILIAACCFSSCTEPWEEHYLNNEASVDAYLWDTLSNTGEFSEFMNYIDTYGLEDYITTTNSKTLFIPGNDAFNRYLNTEDSTGFRKVLLYHISPTLMPVRSVESNRKLLTASGKYSLIEKRNNQYTFDGIEIIYASNLFKDGRYYKLTEVVKPKPNLYEYIDLVNPMIRRYIENQDTVLLDLEESKPIDFTDDGQTVYDSVINVKNMFEQEFFQISEEFRDRSATVIIPTMEQYNNALDDMAQDLGGIFTSHETIPDEWQLDVLIPTLLNKGFYGGIVNAEDFLMEDKIQNIVGDSVKIDFEIDPNSRFIASNGITYKYANYSIDDSLYMGERIIEGESLVDSVGFHRYAWNDKVKVTGRTDFQPVQFYVEEVASNDTVIDVGFETNFSGEYTVEITFEDVFPGEYQLLWRSNYRTSGVYSVYVNGEKPMDVGGMPHDEFDTYTMNTAVFSVIPGRKFWPEKGFNYKDFQVTNLSEYGDVVVKLEYLRPGQGSDPGLSIDFIGLIPMRIAEQERYTP